MQAWRAYRLRWKRRRLIARAWRSRHGLTLVSDRTARIPPGAVLAVSCIRDEADRLPHFLDYYRRLGVGHFLVVDNASTDGSAEILASAEDVSVWRTEASYRASRFGMDWLNHLLARYGRGRWCLTVDADELFVYPDCDRQSLAEFTATLDAAGRSVYGALLLELFPKGSIDRQIYRPGEDPVEALGWFDPGGYRVQVQPRMGNLWVQGGPRARQFFADRPERAPTLNKLPLVRWHWRFAYVNGSHSLLPPRLNDRFEDGNGLLLHTKFLPGASGRAQVEKARGEHFGLPERFADYYDALAAGPDLWHPGARRYDGWRQAEELGLMALGSADTVAKIYKTPAPKYPSSAG